MSTRNIEQASRLRKAVFYLAPLAEIAIVAAILLLFGGVR
jgi:hypothetical protein